MQVKDATAVAGIQLPPGQIVLTDPLIVAVAQIDKLNASLKRMQEESGQQLERTMAERARRIKADHLNDALSLRNDDLCGQVDELLLACEAVIDATDDGLPLDDAIAKVRATWLNYGPSDTSVGEGSEPKLKVLISLPADQIAEDVPQGWPKRPAEDTAAICAIRREFGRTGYRGLGSYCMWLEEQLLDKSREVDALVEAVEVCGPHIAAEILAKAGELKAPKAASNG